MIKLSFSHATECTHQSLRRYAKILYLSPYPFSTISPHFTPHPTPQHACTPPPHNYLYQDNNREINPALSSNRPGILRPAHLGIFWPRVTLARLLLCLSIPSPTPRKQGLLLHHVPPPLPHATLVPWVRYHPIPPFHPGSFKQQV